MLKAYIGVNMKVLILAMALVSISILPASDSVQAEKLNTIAVKKSNPIDDEGPIKPPPGGKGKDRRKMPVCINGVCLG
jgi:hypothetical protein